MENQLIIGKNNVAKRIMACMEHKVFQGDVINKGIAIHGMSTKKHIMSQFTNVGEMIAETKEKVEKPATSSVKKIQKSIDIINELMGACVDDMLQKGEISDSSLNSIKRCL